MKIWRNAAFMRGLWRIFVMRIGATLMIIYRMYFSWTSNLTFILMRWWMIITSFFWSFFLFWLFLLFFYLSCRIFKTDHFYYIFWSFYLYDIDILIFFQWFFLLLLCWLLFLYIWNLINTLFSTNFHNYFF